MDSIGRIAGKGWIKHNSPAGLPAKPDQDETGAPWCVYMLVGFTIYLCGIGIGIWYELTG